MNKEEFELIEEIKDFSFGEIYRRGYGNDCGTIQEIPSKSTHVEFLMDYSSCYYEGDHPSSIIRFYKKKK